MTSLFEICRHPRLYLGRHQARLLLRGLEPGFQDVEDERDAVS